MAQLAIKGFLFRGYEVIKTLEMFGGKNTSKYDGEAEMLCYYIDENGKIECDKDKEIPFPIHIFTLEEFFEQHPYKVGDKVIVKGYTQVFEILSMRWCSERNDVMYSVSNGWFYTEELQPYKEETMNKAVFDANAQCCDIMNGIIKKDMEEIKIDIPKGYEFFGIDDDNKIVLTKKQPQYPKTYEGCCKITRSDPDFYIDTDLYSDKLGALYKLLICRDAYWKLAGEQMGLGKPWEPDWNNDEIIKYCIIVDSGIISRQNFRNTQFTFAFPTEEMRDAFYENFKELIQQCKELL